MAVVPDGNRRWARTRGLGPTEGHRAGIANVGRVAEAAFAAGVETFSFWWGSPANLTRRDPAEIAGIVGVLREWLGGDGVELCRRMDARFEAVGRWRELCPSLIEVVDAMPVDGERTLVLLMAYDGTEEILAAARTGPEDRAAFEAALWTGGLPPVDLLVRTGGEPHFSAGFLLWQLAEAQLAFPDVVWPDYSPERLREDLARFAATERRFGR